MNRQISENSGVAPGIVFHGDNKKRLFVIYKQQRAFWINTFYFAAITEISTFTPRGSAATCTHSRAGSFSVK